MQRIYTMPSFSSLKKKFDTSGFSGAQLVMGFFVGLGIVFGAAVGAAYGNPGAGIAFGIIAGALAAGLVDFVISSGD